MTDMANFKRGYKKAYTHYEHKPVEQRMHSKKLKPKPRKYCIKTKGPHVYDREVRLGGDLRIENIKMESGEVLSVPKLSIQIHAKCRCGSPDPHAYGHSFWRNDWIRPFLDMLERDTGDTPVRRVWWSWREEVLYKLTNDSYERAQAGKYALPIQAVVHPEPIYPPAPKEILEGNWYETEMA